MQISKNKIELITKADEAFFPGVIALFGSLITSKLIDKVSQFTLIDFGIPRKSVQSFLTLVKSSGISVSHIPILDIQHHPRKSESNWYSEAVYALLYPEVFNTGDGRDVVIAVDADILFVSEDALDFNISNKRLYAAPDYPPLDLAFQINANRSPTSKLHVSKNLDLSKTAFNAGFIGATRETFRNLQNICWKYSSEISSIYTNDQGILNLAVHISEEITPHYLSQIYNWRPYFTRAPDVDQVELTTDKNNRIQIESSYFGRVKVVHFCGRQKPWENNNIPFGQLWRKCYEAARYPT